MVPFISFFQIIIDRSSSAFSLVIFCPPQQTGALAPVSSRTRLCPAFVIYTLQTRALNLYTNVRIQLESR